METPDIIKEVEGISTPPKLPNTVADKSHLGTFIPTTVPSRRWIYWFAIFDARTCLYCYKHGNRIYGKNLIPIPAPQAHTSCRFILDYLNSLPAGTASWELMNGADYWLLHYGQLPPITEPGLKWSLWAGEEERTHRDTRPALCVQWEYTKIPTSSFQQRPGVYGTKQT